MKAERTSVSLPAGLLTEARARAAAMRYRNLSQYIAALIEMDLARRGQHVITREEEKSAAAGSKTRKTGKKSAAARLVQTPGYRAIPAAVAHAENPPTSSMFDTPDRIIENRLCEDPPARPYGSGPPPR